MLLFVDVGTIEEPIPTSSLWTESADYKEYAQRVRHRLVRGVRWILYLLVFRRVSVHVARTTLPAVI